MLVAQRRDYLSTIYGMVNARKRKERDASRQRGRELKRKARVRWPRRGEAPNTYFYPYVRLLYYIRTCDCVAGPLALARWRVGVNLVLVVVLQAQNVQGQSYGKVL